MLSQEVFYAVTQKSGCIFFVAKAQYPLPGISLVKELAASCHRVTLPLFKQVQFEFVLSLHNLQRRFGCQRCNRLKRYPVV